MSVSDRRAMLDRGAKALSIRRQCALVGVAWSGMYRPRESANDNDALLMRRIDELFTAWPFLGSRRLIYEGDASCRGPSDQPQARGGWESRRSVRSRTPANPHPATRFTPICCGGTAIERVNQVWAADITYIPIGRGFFYLVAIIDWASRAVLSWRLSNTMDVSFCIAALEEALAKYGAPKIFNTDQGSQFTSTAFTGVLVAAGIAISMDGRGRWMDNVFIERLWRSLKHEDIYLKGYADGAEARVGIAAWMEFYNHRRLHQALAIKRR
jgi:putative transposase